MLNKAPFVQLSAIGSSIEICDILADVVKVAREPPKLVFKITEADP